MLTLHCRSIYIELLGSARRELARRFKSFRAFAAAYCTTSACQQHRSRPLSSRHLSSTACASRLPSVSLCLLELQMLLRVGVERNRLAQPR